MLVLCESLVPLRRYVLASGIPRLERQDYARLCAFSWLMLSPIPCGASVAQSRKNRHNVTNSLRWTWPSNRAKRGHIPLCSNTDNHAHSSLSSFLLLRFQSLTAVN